jgi:hypothetical protein
MDYSAVDIYVCVFNTQPSSASDCSESPAPAPLSNSNGTKTNSVSGGTGSFSAVLVTTLAAGQYVYVTEVATLKTGGTKSAMSTATVVPNGISFGARPDDGNTQITVLGDDKYQFSIYQFDPGYLVVKQNANIKNFHKLDADSAAKAADSAAKAKAATTAQTNAAATKSTTMNSPSADAQKVADDAKVEAAAAKDLQEKAAAAVADARGNPRCGADDLAHGIQLQINTTGLSSGSGSANTTTTSTLATISGKTPNTFTLVQPLVGGTELCLVEYPSSGNGNLYSELTTVNDPFDFGRLSAHFTGGSVITNQTNTSGSATAAEYVNLEIDGALMRAGQRPCAKVGGCYEKGHDGEDKYKKATQGYAFAPGFDLFLSAQLTSFPVAAKSTTNTVNTSGTPTLTSSTSLNVLTSQQGAIVEAGGFLPFRTRGWFKRSYAFEIGPLATARFDTILNPTSSSSSSGTTSSGSSSATSVTTTTSSFSSTYNSWKIGGRIAAGRYPPSSDYMPKPITVFDVSLGPSSNLPSYVCVGSGVGAAAPSSSACNGSTTAPNVSRRLVPRLLISGTFSPPSLPVVLGLDANLAQYGLFKGSSPIDFENKPGNDIRVYIGVRLDFSNLAKTLGLGSSNSNTKSSSNGTTTKPGTPSGQSTN